MKSGKLITGLAIGTIAALIIIPKTRKMLIDAACKLTDSFRDIIDSANEMTDKGIDEVNRMADKAKDIAGTVKATKEAF